MPNTPTKCWRHLVRSNLRRALVLLGVAFAAACQTVSMAPFKKYVDGNDVPKISVADAKKAVDDGTAVIVDSRNELVYKMEHITGSISVPNGSPKEKYDAVPKDKKVITYCACNGEGTSINLAYQMNHAGFPNTYAMVEGFQGWKSAGYPMTKGE